MTPSGALSPTLSGELINPVPGLLVCNCFVWPVTCQQDTCGLAGRGARLLGY